jgi:predicted peroxiredoxin
MSKTQKYLLIESREPAGNGGSGTPDDLWSLATGLVREGHTVTVFLVQNGVFPARPCRYSQRLSAAAAAGVEVLADEFSLRERGIAADRLATGVRAAALDVVIDQLAEGCKALWH